MLLQRKNEKDKLFKEQIQFAEEKEKNELLKLNELNNEKLFLQKSKEEERLKREAELKQQNDSKDDEDHDTLLFLNQNL